MTVDEQRLKLLERVAMDSAIAEGYSFEDDPYGEQIPPSVAVWAGEDPESLERYRRLPESCRWPAWAQWARVPCPHCHSSAVLIRVGSVEDHWFSWEEWEEFYGRMLRYAGR